jgi:hypothetical protein
MHNPISDSVDSRKSDAGFAIPLHRPQSRAKKAPVIIPLLPFPPEIAPAIIALRETAVRTAVLLHAAGSIPRCIIFAASMVNNVVMVTATASESSSLRRCNAFPLCFKEKPPLRNKMSLHPISAKGILF